MVTLISMVTLVSLVTPVSLVILVILDSGTVSLFALTSDLTNSETVAATL